MKRYPTYIISILLLVVGFCSLTLSQKTPTKAKKITNSEVKQPPISKPAYDTKPFDVELQNLPPQYLGHNPESIFDVLFEREKNNKKGEYESTQQYQLRLQKEESIPIEGNLTTKTIFAFGSDKFESSYDADKQILKVFLILNGVEESGSDFLERMNAGVGISINSPKRAVLVKSFSGNRKKYVGTNAFGVRVPVNYVDDFYYLVSLINWNKFGSFSIKPNIGLEKDVLLGNIYIDPQTASNIRNNLGVLIICKLFKPITSYVSDYKEPTVSRPTEGKIEYNYINAELQEFWVYNKINGQVYQKINTQTAFANYLEIKPDELKKEIQNLNALGTEQKRQISEIFASIKEKFTDESATTYGWERGFNYDVNKLFELFSVIPDSQLKNHFILFYNAILEGRNHVKDNPFGLNSSKTQSIYKQAKNNYLSAQNLWSLVNYVPEARPEISEQDKHHNPEKTESKSDSSQQTSTPKTTNVGVVNGKAISLPKPMYPKAARAVRASGAVNVQITIDESGNVTSAKAISGHPLLQQTAVEAARQAKFSPTIIAGQPVSITGVLVYTFFP